MTSTTDLDLLLNEVANEIGKATNKYGPIRSSHEGYAVIQEEVDEMWDEIKKNNIEKAGQEARLVQISW